MSYNLKHYGPYKSFPYPTVEDYEGKKYPNAIGNTECVAFVQQAAHAPHTSFWRQGIKVKDAKPGEILAGTAIATFDQTGRYPTDEKGKHAAIYKSHNEEYITVIDQWNKKGQVTERDIRYKDSKYTGKRNDDGNTYYVIE